VNLKYINFLLTLVAPREVTIDENELGRRNFVKGIKDTVDVTLTVTLENEYDSSS
jgi:hypothetical protein